jgi:ketosteroid isomerase-like protein
MADDLASLAARVRRLEDLLEIQQIFIDYGDHLDRGDFASYATLFASDGEVLLGPMGRAKGPVEIEALMTKVLGGQVGKAYHVISSPVIELDGDVATSHVMWTVVERGADGKPVVSMLGRHVDDLVREDGRWKLRKRRGELDIPSPPGR